MSRPTGVTPAFSKQRLATCDFDPGARLHAWHRAIQALHCNMTFETSKHAPFEGSLKSYSADDFQFVAFDEQQAAFCREWRHIRLDGSNDIELFAPTSGRCTVEQFGLVSECSAGSFVLLDSSAPFRFVQPQRMSALLLKVPRTVFESRVLDMEYVCGRVIQCISGMPRLAIELFHSMERESESLSMVEFRTACSHVVDLVAMALNGSTDFNCAKNSVRQATFRRIKAFIRANASNASLKTSDIAGELGISERYVQILFRPTGMAVRDFIRGERLSAAREQLRGAIHSGKSITQIAYDCGFSNSAHFSAVFREYCGQSPSEYRDAHSNLNKVLAVEYEGPL